MAATIANAGKPAPAPAFEDPTAATEAASSLERSVDLCIIMDCTGSMAAWIDACRDTLIAALDALRAKFPRASFRAAFVGYRDHCDAPERFVLHPLNENVDALIASIRAVRAQGGGDTPEDVAGGLQHALALDWRGDVRLALLCCDAPAHGEKYHDPMMDDSHPKGDPTGLDPADLVKTLAQRRIDLTVFRVNKSVDKMCAWGPAQCAPCRRSPEGPPPRRPAVAHAPPHTPTPHNGTRTARRRDCRCAPQGCARRGRGCRGRRGRGRQLCADERGAAAGCRHTHPPLWL
jgi:hypothetical protein